MEEWFRILHPKVVTLITSVDKEGRINAAPFSWVTPVCDDPPVVLVGAWYESHTFQNISETGEFVINIVPREYKEKVEICARRFKKGENELEKAGLSWSPAKKVKPPRVDGCLGWLECRAFRIEKEEEKYSFILADVLLFEKGKEGEVLLHFGGKDYGAILQALGR